MTGERDNMNAPKRDKRHKACQIEGILCHIVEYAACGEARYRVEIDGRVVDDCKGEGYRSSAAAEEAFKRRVTEARRLLVRNPTAIKRYCEASFGEHPTGNQSLDDLSAMLDGIGVTDREKKALMRFYAGEKARE
jgi:shikimate kinase